MSDDKTINRRTALKIIAVFGVAGATPILGQQPHSGMTMEPLTDVSQPEQRPHFFTTKEMTAVTIISDLIIPTDERSPGAREAGVPAFIDLMVSESPDE